MNVVPRFEQQPEPQARRLWLTNAIVAVFVSLSLAAVTWHVLEGSDLLRHLQRATPVPHDGKVVEQYTRFRTEKIEGGEVVTGFEYAKSTDPVPRSQYCYLMMHRDAGLGLRVTLAAKLPDGVTPIYPPIASEVAGQLGLAADQAAKLARERCHFDRWE
jgi:hypothetical protein